MALLQVLGSFRPPRITISVEVDGTWQTRLDEPGFLIAAGNGPQYGHGMRLTHEARMDDGLLDVCFVRSLSKLRLLRLFRVVYSGAPHRHERSGISPDQPLANRDRSHDRGLCRRRIHLPYAGRTGGSARSVAGDCAVMKSLEM